MLGASLVAQLVKKMSSKASQALPCESRESWVLQRSQKVGARKQTKTRLQDPLHPDAPEACPG